MTIRGAASSFTAAQGSASDPGVQMLARGLAELATSLARELEAMQRKIDALAEQMESLRQEMMMGARPDLPD